MHARGHACGICYLLRTRVDQRTGVSILERSRYVRSKGPSTLQPRLAGQAVSFLIDATSLNLDRPLCRVRLDIETAIIAINRDSSLLHARERSPIVRCIVRELTIYRVINIDVDYFAVWN